MAGSGAMPDVAKLDLSDADAEDLFASPSRSDNKTDPTSDLQTSRTEDEPGRSRHGESRYDAEEAREARDVALRKELEGVRGINEVIEGVVESLERAKGNMDTVSRTVNSASTLLNSWIRILSQTEHNQRLILDPTWQGASQDIADVENESVLRQQAAERRELEEQRRREVASRRADEDERRRADAAATRASRGTKGRPRAGSTRVPSASGSYQDPSGQGRGRTTPSRGIGGAGRGIGGAGRGRGSARGRGRGIS